MEEKKKKLIENHPLYILVTLTLKSGFKLNIKFYYRPQLKIVTVTSEAEIPDSITSICAREVLFGENILNELIEGDFGIVSPNLSNHFSLQKVGFGSYQSLVPKLGYAYTWAQKVCGLDFLSTIKSKEEAVSQSQASVENIVKLLHQRIKSRYLLSEQLQHIGK